jgi:CBS domain-containing protein
MSPRAAWRLESLGFGEVYDYVAGKQDWGAAGLPVEGKLASRPRAGTVARPDVPTCGLEDRVGDVRERVRAAGWDVCVVVNEERVVLGLLREKQLGAGDDKLAHQAMRPGPSTFRPNVEIEDMAEFMVHHDLPSAPVTTSDGRLVGLLKREDAARVALELHAKMHASEEEHDHDDEDE